jgi:hypothetical protein
MYKIIDNFLQKDQFIPLYNVVSSDEFDWYYVSQLNHLQNKEDLTSYFIHLAFSEGKASRYMNVFSSIFYNLKIKALIRVKANLYPRTSVIEKHAPHCDFNFPHMGAILYLNTNNGKTILEDGTEIDSIKNRLLIFDSSRPHSSTSSTDSKARINVNINYIPV